MGAAPFGSRSTRPPPNRVSLARHQGGLSAQAFVHVEVEDLNDNAPVFSPDRYEVSVSSHAQPGAELLTVVATDRDSGGFGRVAYDIVPGDASGLFAVDSQTGGQLRRRPRPWRVSLDSAGVFKPPGRLEPGAFAAKQPLTLI